MTFKALTISRTVADELRRRQSALAVTESVDTDGFPFVRLGTGVAGAPGGIIKIRPIEWPLATDILGLAAPSYTPHVAQVVTEGNPTAGAGADINTVPVQVLLWASALATGCRTEFYTSANANSPGPEDILAANLRTTWDANVQWGMIAGQ